MYDRCCGVFEPTHEDGRPADLVPKSMRAKRAAETIFRSEETLEELGDMPSAPASTAPPPPPPFNNARPPATSSNQLDPLSEFIEDRFIALPVARQRRPQVDRQDRGVDTDMLQQIVLLREAFLDSTPRMDRGLSEDSIVVNTLSDATESGDEAVNDESDHVSPLLDRLASRANVSQSTVDEMREVIAASRRSQREYRPNPRYSQ